MFSTGLAEVRGLTRRINRRARYALLAYTGVRTRDVVFVDAQNAASIAASYRDVSAVSLVEHDACTTVEPRYLSGDDLPGIVPFRTALESVLFDITNSGFSLRNLVVFDDQQRIL